MESGATVTQRGQENMFATFCSSEMTFGICFPNIENNWGSEMTWPKKSMVNRYSDHPGMRVQISGVMEPVHTGLQAEHHFCTSLPNAMFSDITLVA